MPTGITALVVRTNFNKTPSIFEFCYKNLHILINLETNKT